MSMLVSFVLSFFPRDVLDEILNLIGSVSEGFPSYSSFGKRILSLKDSLKVISNLQNSRMLQKRVKIDIYNKFCPIHNTSPLQGKERFMK